MIANIYVDGFNLYYLALRKRFPDCKLLDLRRLAETMFKGDDIATVRYFTARITPRPDKPQQATRQQMYLRALATSDVTVHLGQFRHDKRWSHRTTACAYEHCPTGSMVEVHHTEEKGSDVNLGAYVVRDAALKACELAVVVTNDTDLVGPLKIARDEFGVQVALLTPVDSPARRLVENVDLVRRVRRGSLEVSQFRAGLRDAKGEIHRPSDWRPEKR